MNDKRFELGDVVAKQVDAADVVSAHLVCVDKHIPTKSIVIDFEPKRWVILNHVIDFGQHQSLGVNTYKSAGSVEIASLERWEEWSGSTVKQDPSTAVITSIDYSPIPDNQLTPQAAGLKAMPSTRNAR